MKEFSKKVIPYIIGALFFLIPIFFSHVLKVLGFPIIFGSSSYERVKVELFYTLLLILIPVWIISPFFQKSREFILHRKNIFWGLAFLAILTLSTLLASDIQSAVWGGIEKKHGAVFFIALWIFLVILKTLPEIYHTFFLKISFFSLIFVLFYATMQWMGLDQLGSRYTLGFSGDRAFSTLGNPNYLAGYFILFLPLVQKVVKTRAMKNFWYGILLFGVSITGSLLGIGIVLVYLMIKLFLGYKMNRLYILAGIITCVIGVDMISPIIPVDKVGSIEHRLIIWETSIHMVSASPDRFLFGYGLEQFKSTFPLSWEDGYKVYFTSNTPDSAHNIFLDVLFSFGIIGFMGFIIFLQRFFKNHPISSIDSQVMILFLVFFSFNIPVLVHFLILTLVISTSFSSHILHSPPRSYHPKHPDNVSS